MITVSLIREYLYCPLSVYIELDNSKIDNSSILAYKLSREAFRGFEEILKRNLWTLKGRMQFKEILEEIFKDVPEYLESVYLKFEDEIINEEIGIRFESLKEDLKFNSWIIAIKSQKILNSGITGSDAVDILFPPCLNEFTIEDKENGLLGKVDKIEIIDGVYYPIKFKTSFPPLKGVWDSDALQLTAYAILMEYEFNKEVPVGFVNYIKLGSKKPVLINSFLREEFLNVYNELWDILYNGYVPEVVKNPKKCRACNYSEICDYTIG
jgi:CRISPR-associated exonuclease Cas4